MKYFQILLLLGINISTILLSQSIEIPHKMMNQNTTLNIPIFIYNVSELESIQLIIEYDETIVNALEIIENPVGILDGGYNFTPNITGPGGGSAVRFVPGIPIPIQGRIAWSCFQYPNVKIFKPTRSFLVYGEIA